MAAPSGASCIIPSSTSYNYKETGGMSRTREDGRANRMIQKHIRDRPVKTLLLIPPKCSITFFKKKTTIDAKIAKREQSSMLLRIIVRNSCKRQKQLQTVTEK